MYKFDALQLSKETLVATTKEAEGCQNQQVCLEADSVGINSDILAAFCCDENGTSEGFKKLYKKTLAFYR